MTSTDTVLAFVPTTRVGGNGSLVLLADGSWTYTLDSRANSLAGGDMSEETFVVKLTDGSLARITIDVTGTNDAPVAVNDNLAAVEDTPIIFTAAQLLSNDTDIDSPASSLSIASVTPGAGGTAVLNPDGTVTFTPNANFTGNADFTYTVTDGTLISNAATVTVAVAAANDAPVAVNDNLAAVEDTPIIFTAAQLLGNDTDIDSPVSSLSIASVTPGAGGTAVLNPDGTVTFTPNANFTGNADFTYTVTDGTSTSNAATVTVAVAAAADTPTLSVLVDENSGVTSIPVPLPPTEGLTSDRFVGIASVGPANAANLTTVEAGVESTAPTSTAIITNLSYATIAVDDAYHVKGFIFLEAGRTYQLAGSRDDTLLVKIGGTTVYSVGHNAWGDLYAGQNDGGALVVAPISLPITKSGYYSLEVVMYNGDGAGNLDLNLSVDGAAPVDISTANFNLYTSATTVENSGTADAFVSNGDGGFYPLANTNTPYSYFALNVSAALTDTDGSETLALSAAGIPVGTTLTDGFHTFVGSVGSTSTDISDWSLSELTVIPATGQTASFNLTFTATATDGASTASSVQTVTLDPSDNATANIIGTAGSNTLTGGSGANALFGLDGNDTLVGSGGGDLFVGGGGNDTMSGALGADTFRWNFGDQGTVASPAQDTLTNFASSQGDSINLSDLLQNEAGADLTKYLHFEVTGADTTISISSTGAFNGGNYATATDQTIVLSNLNLSGTDTAIIDQLKNNGNLITD